MVVQAGHCRPKNGGLSTRNVEEAKLSGLLNGIYQESETECDIDIVFNVNASGSQQNDCWDLLLAYVRSPTAARAHTIAERLANVPTNVIIHPT